MAILQTDGLAFEFKFWRLLEGWMQYHYYFLWQGEPIIRDSLLCHPEDTDWKGRPTGALMADDDQRDECGLIKALREALETGERAVWLHNEDMIIVSVSPYHHHPLSPLQRTVDMSKRGHSITPDQKFPDDEFTLVVWADASNFKKFRGARTHGPMFHLQTNRKDIQQFLADLEHEYSEFRQAHATEFDM